MPPNAAQPDPVTSPLLHEERIPCPMCDYDLRGLVEPRCPECGYRFAWQEFTEPAYRGHRIAYEHGHGLAASRFVRTLMAGLRPARFWGNMFPTQPACRRRLLLYWFLVAVPALLAIALLAAHAMIEAHRRNAALRMPGTVPTPQVVGAVPITAVQLLPTATQDRYYPLWPSPWLLLAPLRMRVVKAVAAPLLAMVLWPALAWLLLNVFRASMGRARVGTQHVLRCVVYCGDTMFWAGSIILATVAWNLLVEIMGVQRGLGAGRLVAVTVLLLLAVLIVNAYRLAAAYRHYMRIDHPRAVSASVFTIILLILLVVLAEGDKWNWWR